MKKFLLSLVFLPLISLFFLLSSIHAYAATRLEPLSYEPIPCGSSCTTLRVYYNQVPPAGGWGLANWGGFNWSGSAGPTNIHDTYADYTWNYPYNQGIYRNVLGSGDNFSSPFTIDLTVTQPTTFPTFNSVEVTGYEFIPCGSTCATVRIYYNQVPPAGGWGLVNWYNHTMWSGAAGATNIHDTYADYTIHDPYVPTTPWQFVIASADDFSSPFTVDYSTLPINWAPSVQSLSNATINEGDTYSATGSFTDPDSSTSWTATVDYGDGSGSQPLTLSGTNFTLNHTYTTAGTFTVTVSITDNQGATGTGTAQVTVNAPPQVNSFSGGTINEGGTYTSSGSFSDSDSTSWTSTVDYGDGSGSQSLTLSGTNFSLSHVYKDNGTYTVTVSVTDNQGATGTGTTAVTVNNVAPTPGAITAPSSPVLVNTAITASANFTDPGVLDTHTASWNWGDGNTTTGTVTESNGSGSVSNSHTYTATGVYMITLTVTDKDGGVGTSTFQYVAVYDSTSSFAGGRSFDNPTSASPSTTGKVSFGISAKYNNSNVLTGSAKMDFKAANLDFASTSLSSLATSNGKAYLKGSGTLNGNSGYTFLATGIDGSVAGGVDLIRFQIKDSSNTVVYDSQPGAGDTVDPTTTDATGNIRVH